MPLLLLPFINMCIEDNALPEGTFPILLTPITQEKFECVVEWDLSALEPQKLISAEKIREDLQTLGPASDFDPLKHQIEVSSQLQQPSLHTH